MQTTDFSDMVGVFRDRAPADEAVNDLKQAGFGEDQIDVTEYELQGVVDSLTPAAQATNKRVVVHVKAVGREQEAVGIMAKHGANNADIPIGLKLVRGKLEGTNAETAGLPPGHPEPAGTSNDLYGEVTTPGHPNDINIMDRPDSPHQ